MKNSTNHFKVSLYSLGGAEIMEGILFDLQEKGYDVIAIDVYSFAAKAARARDPKREISL